MPATRRVFMLQVATGPAALAAAVASAQDAPARVDAKDPQAASLGYTEDAGQVDARRFPRRTAEQLCANCQVYSGKGNEPTGPCTVFAGKLVTAKGWCSAWVLKAA
ncbi:MAG: high-potential iron-sulfur protein [Ramlibacter sp.]